MVKPPENTPEVNLYFVRIFQSDPREGCLSGLLFSVKFVSRVFLHRAESGLFASLNSRVINGMIISAVTLSNPGIFASSYTETIFPDEVIYSVNALTWKSERKNRREISSGSAELILTGSSISSWSLSVKDEAASGSSSFAARVSATSVTTPESFSD